MIVNNFKQKYMAIEYQRGHRQSWCQLGKNINYLLVALEEGHVIIKSLLKSPQGRYIENQDKIKTKECQGLDKAKTA